MLISAVFAFLSINRVKSDLSSFMTLVSRFSIAVIFDDKSDLTDFASSCAILPEMMKPATIKKGDGFIHSFHQSFHQDSSCFLVLSDSDMSSFRSGADLVANFTNICARSDATFSESLRFSDRPPSTMNPSGLLAMSHHTKPAGLKEMVSKLDELVMCGSIMTGFAEKPRYCEVYVVMKMTALATYWLFVFELCLGGIAVYFG